MVTVKKVEAGLVPGISEQAGEGCRAVLTLAKVMSLRGMLLLLLILALGI